MDSGAKDSAIARFGLFALDTSRKELRKTGRRMKIQGQPLEVLQVLVERPGKLVSRTELQRVLWSDDTLVDFEHGLNKAISRIRAVLGDSAENPRFVETVQGEGYRFIAPVEWVTPPEKSGATPVAPDPPSTDTLKTGRRSWPLWLGACVLGILGISWYYYRDLRIGGSVSEQKLTSRTPDLPVGEASISPDGKYVALADEEGLWLRLVEKNEMHKLEMPPGVALTHIAWLPDSTALLISAATKSAQISSLWMVSLFGEQPRRLRDDAGQGTPSPDGARIAFTSGDSKQIWTMASDGEDARRISTAGQGEEYGGFVWSRDGRALVYNRVRSSQNDYEIFLEWRDLGTGKTNVILREPGLRSYCGTPEGLILYARLESPANTNDTNLWRLRVDMQTGRVVEGAQRVTNWPAVSLSSLSVTFDGKNVAVTKGTTHLASYVLDLAKAGEAPQKIIPLTFHDRDDYPLAWDAESHTVYLTSNRDGVWKIFRQDLRRHASEYVAGGAQNAKYPTLTPDGRWILYQAVPRANIDWSTPIKLLRIPASGGPPQEVWQGQGFYRVQCPYSPATQCALGTRSADGKYLAISAFDPLQGKGQELVRVSEDVTPVEIVYAWALSPDGLEVAISQPGEMETRILCKSLSGAAERTLLVKGWRGFQTIAWTADGTGFFLLMESGNGSTILRVDREGTARVILKSGRPVLHWCVPSPDGRWLAFAELDSSTNVSVLSGF